jgi:hypothetical protein
MSPQGFPKPQDILSNMIKQSLGIDRYGFIIKEIHTRDISKVLDYQGTFNAFHVVIRYATWRKILYEQVESQKKNKNYLLKLIFLILLKR